MEPRKNEDLERALIGGMLISGEMAQYCATKLDPKWFYGNNNLAIFNVLCRHVVDGVMPDMVLACQWLSTAGILGDVGGQQYLADCTEKVSTPAHMQHYVSELEQLYLDRQILVAVTKVTQDPCPVNIERLREASQRRDSADSKGVIDIADCAGVIEEMTRPIQHGLYDLFGMPEMDEFFNGTRGGDILTIGARPCVGKTVMATHIAINFARKYKEPVLYFSTEMCYEETIARVLSPLSRVPGWKFRKRYFDKEGSDIRAITTAAAELTGLKFYMVDKSEPSMADIRSAMARTKCKLVVIDYIQHINFDVQKGEGLPQAIDRAMKGIKQSAKDLNAVVVLTSQMDRETDHLTARQRPQMADLKGSSGIEQESDAIILLHKHNKKDRDSKQDTVPEIRNIRPVEAIHAKNRHGKTDVSVQLIFDEKIIEFREWSAAEHARLNDQIIPKAPKKEKKSNAKPKWGDTGGHTADPDEDSGELPS